MPGFRAGSCTQTPRISLQCTVQHIRIRRSGHLATFTLRAPKSVAPAYWACGPVALSLCRTASAHFPWGRGESEGFSPPLELRHHVPIESSVSVHGSPPARLPSPVATVPTQRSPRSCSGVTSPPAQTRPSADPSASTPAEPGTDPARARTRHSRPDHAGIVPTPPPSILMRSGPPAARRDLSDARAPRHDPQARSPQPTRWPPRATHPMPC